MTATEELRRMLDERGVAHSDHYLSTSWRDGYGILHLAGEPMTNGLLVVDMLRPEQAIAATLVSEINGDTIETHLNQLESSRYSELFGTPELAARTIWSMQMVTDLMGCCDADTCPAAFDECWKLDSCPMDDYDTLLEWMRGDA